MLLTFMIYSSENTVDRIAFGAIFEMDQNMKGVVIQNCLKQKTNKQTNKQTKMEKTKENKNKTSKQTNQQKNNSKKVRKRHWIQSTPYTLDLPLQFLQQRGT